MLPDFYIIGSQKSGTSFLHNCLMAHPEIYMPEEEIPYFERKHSGEKKNLKSFEKLFEGMPGNKKVGIKRPSYLGREGCELRIHKATPNAKLIAVLRNPTERAVSSYYHFMKMGLMPIIPIENGLKTIFTKGKIVGFPRTKWIKEYGFYNEHIKRYYKLFNKKQLLIILYDDLKNNPSKVIKNIYNFVGVNSDFLPDKNMLRSKPQKGIYSYPQLLLKRLTNIFLYKKTKYGIKNRKMNVVRRLVIYLLNGIKVVIFDNVFIEKKPKLSPGLRKIILGTYLEDIENLEKLLAKDLFSWKN